MKVWKLLPLAVLAGCGVTPQVETLSVVKEPTSICEIANSDDGMVDVWGVYGSTEQPRGTVFEFVVNVDGKEIVTPMIAKAGSIYIDGKLYGHKDGYVDDGTNTNFGLTSADMVVLDSGHGVVNAKVTLNGVTVCESA